MLDRKQLRICALSLFAVSFMTGLISYVCFLDKKPDWIRTGIRISRDGLIRPEIYFRSGFSPILGWIYLSVSILLALIGILIALNLKSAWSFEDYDYEQYLRPSAQPKKSKVENSDLN
jgi:hypothetical protein